ncbi:MAG: hypothetical protein HN392_13915 [Anaerolineae bacterium]|nr:hypothetical protein [Anaerolineae bacterium]MBT7075205.1 hypothetical protein [Anaerolineae bacterium]MBT7783853.1 hypothetical protein [Anaerolineae bacterium]
MVSIRLYGNLRRYAKNKSAASDSIIEAEVKENEEIYDFLERLGFDIGELYTIFVNSRLLTSRTKIAPFLGYQQVCEDECLCWELKEIIKDGDRIGLFGEDMPALVA